MTIKIDEVYSLEQDNISPIHWNVLEKVIVKDEKSKNYGLERMANIAYGLTLPGAIHHVIMKKSADREAVVSLKEWVEIYQKTVNKLTEKFANHGN